VPGGPFAALTRRVARAVGELLDQLAEAARGRTIVRTPSWRCSRTSWPIARADREAKGRRPAVGVRLKVGHQPPELLDQLAEAAQADERVVRFAAARRAEVAAGRVDAEHPDPLTEQELGALVGGFLRIRDQEPRDDVADWANAVVALLEDDLATAEGRR